MQTTPLNAAPTSDFTIGSVLSRSFETLMKNPVVFFGLTFSALLPATVLTILLGAGLAAGASMSGAFVMFAFVGIVQGVCVLVSQGAIAYAVYHALRGTPASFGAAVARGLARFLPLFVAALLIGIGTAIGFMLLIVPGAILMCMWIVSVPACVVERRGAVESMTRSAELTKGYRWKVFALIIITALATNALSFLVTRIAGASGSVVVIAIVTLVVLTVPQAFISVMYATTYYELRRVKEGVSMDALAHVFD